MRYVKHVKTVRYDLQGVRKLEAKLVNESFTAPGLAAMVTSLHYLAMRIELERLMNKPGRKTTVWLVEHVFAVPRMKYDEWDKLLARILLFTSSKQKNPFVFFWRYTSTGGTLLLHLFIPRPPVGRQPGWKALLSLLQKCR